MYQLIRPLLFAVDPEAIHDLTLDGLRGLQTLGLARLLAPRPADDPHTVMGLQFPNAVGLAAGLDKNGDCIDGLAALGFGFIEIGTVTPLRQSGNPMPRLFRLPQANAIINRMGFNNDGIDSLLQNVRESAYRGILGINIGKNAITPIEHAADDYLICLRKAYAFASYIAINVSSPNTKNLRQLQDEDALHQLLSKLKEEQQRLADTHGRYVPIAVKIAPDLEDEQIAQMSALLMKHRIDGVIATNTTLSRVSVEHLPHGDESGGLSGQPVRDRSTLVIRKLAAQLQNSLPIIGVGGIINGNDALEKIGAGAALVQVYTGLIYRGPALVSECVNAIRRPHQPPHPKQ